MVIQHVNMIPSPSEWIDVLTNYVYSCECCCSWWSVPLPAGGRRQVFPPVEIKETAFVSIENTVQIAGVIQILETIEIHNCEWGPSIGRHPLIYLIFRISVPARLRFEDFVFFLLWIVLFIPWTLGGCSFSPYGSSCFAFQPRPWRNSFLVSRNSLNSTCTYLLILHSSACPNPNPCHPLGSYGAAPPLNW